LIVIPSSVEKVVDMSSSTARQPQSYASLTDYLATPYTPPRTRAYGPRFDTGTTTTTNPTHRHESGNTRLDYSAPFLDTNGNNVQNSTTAVSVTFASKQRPEFGIPENIRFTTQTFNASHYSDFIEGFRTESTASSGLLMM
jgi:hypothetical protein